MKAAISPSLELPPSPVAATVAVEQIRVRRRPLKVMLENCERAMLENCERALELLENPVVGSDPSTPDPVPSGQASKEEEGWPLPPQSVADTGTDELCSLLKSKVESRDFLEKIGSIQTSIYQNKQAKDDNASWNLITSKDLREDNHIDGEIDLDQDDYVLVSQEDIVDSIACFMAAYLLSLKHTKDLTPKQLQEALCKAFSVKKKSWLRKAWDGSQVIYTIASWGATAIGLCLVFHVQGR